MSKFTSLFSNLSIRNKLITIFSVIFVTGFIINFVVNAVEKMATAANEQSSGAEGISKNIEGVTTVSKESASSAQMMATSAEQLNKEVRGLNDLISQFKA